MKNVKFVIFALVGICFGCQQAVVIEPTETGKAMKTVTIKAEMNVTDTKAAIDSQTGTVTWQSGDLLSVLATDEYFYDFILTSGAGERFAEFEGKVPEAADVVITTVATYPRIIDDGSYNMIQFEDELLYYLPEEWIYAKDVSNVPMVASFEEGASELSFKQVGGVMRFPIKNLPGNSKVVFNMADKVITGDFPVDLSALGESAMVAGDGSSEVTINYTSDKTDDVEINLPVPTGVYDNFTLTVYNKNDEAIFTKKYSANNEVKRATLLLMSEVVVPEQPLEIAEVWPFFVDARVILPKNEGVTKYAVYVDDAQEPVILEAEDWGDNAAVLVGGEFAHKSTHNVAVAKVVEGVVVPETKSEAVSFTTEDVFQLTKNTGTKFVSIGWNDVTIANGPKFIDGKWQAISVENEPDVDAHGRKLHQRRGYKVELYAADKSTLLYSMIPFAGHTIYQNAFYDSRTFGMVNGHNLITPTALTFGHLEPGKDYYFRVKAIDDVEIIGLEQGNYYPGDQNVSNPKPFPYQLSSERGGCAWSDFVKVSTDALHVPVANEIFHEGFDDVIHNGDYINWAATVVPDFYTSKAIPSDEYYAILAENYNSVYAEDAITIKDWATTKWTVLDWNTIHCENEFGIENGAPGADGVNGYHQLNERAGSLNGWILNIINTGHINFYPGAVGLGKGMANHGGSYLITEPINSDLLDAEKATKCTVTLQVTYGPLQDKARAANTVYVKVTRNAYDADGKLSVPTLFDVSGVEKVLSIPETYPEEWNAEFMNYHTLEGTENAAPSTNYVNYPRYFELKTEVYLKKGDSVKFGKKTTKPQYGQLVIGDISVVVHPGEFEPEVQPE